MKRFLSFFLVVALCVGIFRPVKAHAVGALTVGAVATVSAAIMASFGYKWVCDNMDAQSFQDSIAEKINEFLAENQFGIDILAWAGATAFELRKPGELFISKDYFDKMLQFVGWFREKYALDGVEADTPVSLQSYGRYFDTNGFTFTSSPLNLPVVNYPSSAHTIKELSPGAFLSYKVEITEPGVYTSIFRLDTPDFSSDCFVLDSAHVYVDNRSFGLVYPEFYTYERNDDYFLYFYYISDEIIQEFESKSSSLYFKFNLKWKGSSAAKANTDYPLFLNYNCFSRDLSSVFPSVIAPVDSVLPDVETDKEYKLVVPTAPNDLESLSTALAQQAVDNTLEVTGEVVQEGTDVDNPSIDEPVVTDGLLDRILAAIMGIPQVITDGALSVVNAVIGLGQTIVDGVVSGIQALFIPSDAVVDSIKSDIDEHLPIIPDLQKFGSDFQGALENPAEHASNLTFVVDLGKRKDGAYGTAKINLLDASWYLPYKPLGDDIVVGLAWLVFLWNLYGALPSIIHGGASALYSTGRIQEMVGDDDDK